jgi:sugar lactone lactonase YvrE
MANHSRRVPILRSIATLTQRLKRTLSGASALLLLALLVTAAAPPAWGQPESAPPEPAKTPAAEPGPPATPPTTEAPAAETPEPPAVTPAPSATPDPAATPSIEDLYAPDLPRKTDEKSPAATEQPKSKEPVLYISDSDNGRIVVMQGINGEGFTSLGMPGYGLGRFLRPGQVWLDYASRLHVADSGNNRVVRIDQNAAPGWSEVGDLSEPRGVAVDGSGVYVSDTKADRIVIYDEVLDKAKIREVLTHPQLKRPGELWIDSEGALYICCGEDPPGGKLLKTWVEKGLKENGEEKQTRRWTVFAGDGLTGSRFLPASVVTEKANLKLLDVSGQRMVTMQDMAGKRLREDKFRVDPRWRLSRPSGMAIDAEGRVFVADSGNDRILQIGKDGSVTGEFYILDEDTATLLSNPCSIFIYSPAPPPPLPEEGEDEDGKNKPKAKPKKPAEDELEFDSGF